MAKKKASKKKAAKKKVAKKTAVKKVEQPTAETKQETFLQKRRLFAEKQAADFRRRFPRS